MSMSNLCFQPHCSPLTLLSNPIALDDGQGNPRFAHGAFITPNIVRLFFNVTLAYLSNRNPSLRVPLQSKNVHCYQGLQKISLAYRHSPFLLQSVLDRSSTFGVTEKSAIAIRDSVDAFWEIFVGQIRPGCQASMQHNHGQVAVAFRVP